MLGLGLHFGKASLPVAERRCLCGHCPGAKTCDFGRSRLDLPVAGRQRLVAYAAYLGQMLYPVGLAVLYPHPGNRLSVWKVGLSVLVLIDHFRGRPGRAAKVSLPAGGLAVVSGDAGARHRSHAGGRPGAGGPLTPTCRKSDCISWWLGGWWNCGCGVRGRLIAGGLVLGSAGAVCRVTGRQCLLMGAYVQTRVLEETV